LSQEEAGEAQRAEVDDVKMTSTGAARETVNKEEKFDFDSDIDMFGRGDAWCMGRGGKHPACTRAKHGARIDRAIWSCQS
jgi:hypothetical protein